MAPWQRDFNQTTPQRAPGPAQVSAIASSYNWGSLQSPLLQSEQVTSGVVLVPSTSTLTPVLTFRPQAPVSVRLITVFMSSASNTAGFVIVIDNQPVPWSNLFNFSSAGLALANIISPGLILTSLGATAANFTTMSLPGISITGTPNAQTMTVFNVPTTLQQVIYIQGWASAAGSTVVSANIEFGAANSLVSPGPLYSGY